MNAGLDSFGLQGLHDRRARHTPRKQYRHDVNSDPVPASRKRACEWRLDVQSLQALQVLPPHLAPPRQKAVQLPELRQGQAGTDLVDPEIPARFDAVVGPGMALVPVKRQTRHPVGAQQPKFLSDILPVRRHHPTFATGHVLVGEETETAAGAECSQRPAIEMGKEGVRAVLDDDRVVSRGQGDQGANIGGEPRIVNGYDRLGATRHLAFNVRDVEGQIVLAANVTEDHFRPAVTRRVRRRHEGQGRHNHFVAGADADGQQGQVQRGGAVGHGNRLTRAGSSPELVLEFRGDGTHRQPLVPQRSLYGSEFVGTEVGFE